MYLKLKIPFNIYVLGINKEDLSLEVSYKQNKKYLCKLKILGDISENIIDIESTNYYIMFGELFEITIDEINNSRHLENLIILKDKNEISKLLQKVVNRFIKAIRNYGEIFNLHEKGINEKFEEILLEWDVMYSYDNANWTLLWEHFNRSDANKNNQNEGGEIIKHLRLFKAIYGKEQYKKPVNEPLVLLVDKWLEVKTALENDFKLDVENEFIVNATEYIRTKNFRLAIIESIISLEIALNRYLKLYFKQYNTIVNREMEKDLDLNVDLYHRVALLIPVTLSQITLKDLNISSILKTIGWRNNIVHGEGNKIKEIDDAEIENNIKEVLTLTRFLKKRSKQPIYILNNSLSPLLQLPRTLNDENK